MRIAKQAQIDELKSQLRKAKYKYNRLKKTANHFKDLCDRLALRVEMQSVMKSNPDYYPDWIQGAYNSSVVEGTSLYHQIEKMIFQRKQFDLDLIVERDALQARVAELEELIKSHNQPDENRKRHPLTPR